VKIANLVGGLVTSSPGGIDGCGSSCSATYDYGTKVVLTATPSTDYLFGKWSGACSSAPCIVGMSDNKAVSAFFNRRLGNAGVSTRGQLKLSGVANGGTAVPYTCNGDVGGCPAAWGFDAGSEVVVQATGDAPGSCTSGAVISGWPGSFSQYVPIDVSTFYISSFGTANQGINWMIGTCAGGAVPQWRYGGCVRQDLPVPYTSSTVGVSFMCRIG
jgi:hypothetical protein